MAVTVTHTKVVVGADEPGKEVNAGEWNGTGAHTVVVEPGTITTTELGGDITTAGKALLDDAAASNQRTTLGLGTIATQAADNVAITGGAVSGITDLAVADGGTGASTAQAARTNLETQQTILCPSNLSTINPADATTYFFGAWVIIANAGYNRIYFRRACRIKEVRLAVVVAATLGSTQQATVSVRLNNTTDTTVSSVVQYDAAGPTPFDNTTLDIAIAAGDFIEMKVVMPTFDPTNPTSVYHICEIVTE